MPAIVAGEIVRRQAPPSAISGRANGAPSLVADCQSGRAWFPRRDSGIRAIKDLKANGGAAPGRRAGALAAGSSAKHALPFRRSRQRRGMSTWPSRLNQALAVSRSMPWLEPSPPFHHRKFVLEMNNPTTRRWASGAHPGFTEKSTGARRGRTFPNCSAATRRFSGPGPGRLRARHFKGRSPRRLSRRHDMPLHLDVTAAHLVNTIDAKSGWAVCPAPRVE